jgi:hypothetical protein
VSSLVYGTRATNHLAGWGIEGPTTLPSVLSVFAALVVFALGFAEDEKEQASKHERRR